MANALTVKQAKFIESYLVSNNAKQSAINAGYPEKSSASIGWELLKNAKVLAAIDSSRTKLSNVITKEKYIDKALEAFEKLEVTEPNSPRFYDLAGKALGYIGASNDSKQINNTLNITNIQIKGDETQSQLWELTRKLLGND